MQVLQQYQGINSIDKASLTKFWNMMGTNRMQESHILIGIVDAVVFFHQKNSYTTESTLFRYLKQLMMLSFIFPYTSQQEEC